jgi:hypothetical protein
MAKKRGTKQEYGGRSAARAGEERSSDTRRGSKRPQGAAICDGQQLVTAANSEKFKPIKRRRRRRIRLGEALRKVGLDEQTVAETYVGVIEVLREQTAREPGRKLLVDVLKECSRVLEPPRSTGTNADEPLTIVEMRHEMSRPERERQDADATEEEAEP